MWRCVYACGEREREESGDTNGFHENIYDGLFSLDLIFEQCRSPLNIDPSSAVYFISPRLGTVMPNASRVLDKSEKVAQRDICNITKK